jgi:hypothetical protein
MNEPTPKYVPQRRAAMLLGLAEDELSRISRESGLGHTERAGDRDQIFFTYEELRRICLLSVQHVQ